MSKNILWFDQIGKDDIGQVGGKGANLGEMVDIGMPVPFGFVVTSSAFNTFLKKNALAPIIKKLLMLKLKDKSI